LLLGCFGASLLDDPRREQQRRNKGALQAFFQAFPKLACFVQAFPNKVLAVLWNFKGLQGFQTSFDGFQIFHSGCPLRPHFGRYHAAFSGAAPWGSMAVSRSHGFAVR
jgi:hypothetical protein